LSSSIPALGRGNVFSESLELKKRIISIFLLLLAVAPCAQAGIDYNDGLRPAQQALAAGNYAKAFALYSRQAAKNPLAQFSLGLFHRNGWGRPVNQIEACLWFEKAANRQIPVAQQFFGDCLSRGIGRPADSKSAIDWYKKAAAGGDLIAQCSAADLYIKGKGVDKDVQQGLQLCAQVAQANSPPAMLILGDYYREGTDVPQDLAAARYWYQQAAERRSPEAQYRLGVMLAEGQGGEPDLNAALFWLETAAGVGYAPAYLPTAILYANAEVDPKTGALKPEHLAKIYLWNSAAKARTADPAQLAEIDRIEKLVLAVMPETWRPDLDKKVAEHLAKYELTR
jgi:TPR repeat protein